MGNIINSPVNKMINGNPNENRKSGRHLHRQKDILSLNATNSMWRRAKVEEIIDRIDESIVNSGRSHLLTVETIEKIGFVSEVFLLNQASFYLRLNLSDLKTKRAIKETLMPSFRPLNIGINNFVFKEGDTGTNLFILESGSLSVSVGEIEICVLEGGSVFGEVSTLFGYPRTVTIKSIEKCKL